LHPFAFPKILLDKHKTTNAVTKIATPPANTMVSPVTVKGVKAIFEAVEYSSSFTITSI